MRQIGKRNENPSLQQHAQFENVIVTKKNLKALKGSSVSTVDWKCGEISDEPLAWLSAVEGKAC